MCPLSIFKIFYMIEDSLHDQYTVTCEEYYPEDLYGMVRAEDQEDPKEGPQP